MIGAVIAVVLVLVVVLKVRRYKLTGTALRAVREPGEHSTLGHRSYRTRQTRRGRFG